MIFQKSARMAVLDGVNSRLTLNSQLTWLVAKVLTIIENTCSSEYMGSRPFHVRTLSKGRFNLRYAVIHIASLHYFQSVIIFITSWSLRTSFLIIKVYRICRRVDFRTHVSFTRVSIPISSFEFGMWPHIMLVGPPCTRDAPTFSSLIQHFRLIAVRLAMKRVTLTIALHQIVAVLVRLFFSFYVTLGFDPLSSYASKWRT